MLHYYEIDIVPLHDDRVGAIFSPIIDKISNSQRLTMPDLSSLCMMTEWPIDCNTVLRMPVNFNHNIRFSHQKESQIDISYISSI